MSANAKIRFQLAQDEDGYPPAAVESVWASPTDKPDEYEIHNVPFFAREATIEDTVRVRAEDGDLWFDTMVRASGNSLIRIVFFDKSSLDRINAQLIVLGCATEYLRAHNLLAVSVPSGVNLTSVQEYLSQESSAETIDYEEAILRQ